jgi:hypothetical protein
MAHFSTRQLDTRQREDTENASQTSKITSTAVLGIGIIWSLQAASAEEKDDGF